MEVRVLNASHRKSASEGSKCIYIASANNEPRRITVVYQTIESGSKKRKTKQKTINGRMSVSKICNVPHLMTEIHSVKQDVLRFGRAQMDVEGCVCNIVLWSSI